MFKEVHNTWPPKNGKPGGEAYDLLCMDMSNPAEHRMEEMLYYRLRDEGAGFVCGASRWGHHHLRWARPKSGTADNGGKATVNWAASSTEAKKSKSLWLRILG